MVFICVGILALVLSIFLLFFPRPFLSVSEFLNRIFLADDIALKYRVGIGICLILVSFLLFFTAYYILRTG